MPLIFDETLSRLLGTWIADGSKTQKRSIKIKDSNLHHLENLLAIFSNHFEINGKIFKVKGKNCHELIMNSVELTNVLKNLYKNLGELILCNEGIIGAFCGAMFDQDGCVQKHEIVFHQTEKRIVDILQFLLLRLGINSSVTLKKNKNEWSKSDIYLLRLKGPNKYRILQFMLNKDKIAKYKISKGRNRQKLFDDNWIISKVRKIEKVGKRNVVDISVPGEYFIANGILTHNSAYRIYLRKGKKGSRVAKLIDSPHLPEGAARFMITTDGLRDI